MAILSAEVRRRLKGARAAHEPYLSQYTLGQKTGIGINRYWRIESGYAEPTDQERAAIAKTLGVDEGTLFHETTRT